MPPGARSSAMDPDVVLMLRVRDGDQEAFQALYRKHGPRVLQFIRRSVGNEAIADELAQDVFLQMYKARKRYQPTARFTTWLYTIAANVCKNGYRRLKQEEMTRGRDRADEPTTFDPPDTNRPTSEEVIRQQEIERHLRNALTHLPPKQRSAFLLARVDGLAYRDVARALGCSEGAVKALLNRATNSLRRDMHFVLDAGGGGTQS